MDLVIVESPAKARTIERYLGPGYHVMASVGHVRDLPKKEKGKLVPGVDLENGFEPTWEILPDKKKQKVISTLKKKAAESETIWFATDLDREGEAIAWHLAELLGIDPTASKRVVFNAITKQEISRAFTQPRPIDLCKVDAYKTRRIIDRIVGYRLSSFLWKKVLPRLSAGRVQSVAVRLVVEREREIDAFIPDEYWKAGVLLATEPADSLAESWCAFRSTPGARGDGPTRQAENAWLEERAALRAELVEVPGLPFAFEKKKKPGPTGDRNGAAVDAGDKGSQGYPDKAAPAAAVAEAIGLEQATPHHEANPDGRGPAQRISTLTGSRDPAALYRVDSLARKETTSSPRPPLITSSLQMAASSELGFGAQKTMRIAQQLYEGVVIPGEGEVGLITYMRTDSTSLSQEAITQARTLIESAYGREYLPDTPNFHASKKQAQEAHEAIRPTSFDRLPDEVESLLTKEQASLYRLVWQRSIASQMTPARWNQTTVMLHRCDRETGVVLKATGRALQFDGFYRASGIPKGGDQLTLPPLVENQVLNPFDISVTQHFTKPPQRYTEAGLIKKLEKEGIGRPSTYAPIIQLIQDRGYVSPQNRAFHATDIGDMVTRKLVQGFPKEVSVEWTKNIETYLDRIADGELEWRSVIGDFYASFESAIEHALEHMSPARAEKIPAPYSCQECGGRTVYRFGSSGRFLACLQGKEACPFTCSVNRRGQPVLPQAADIACPACQAGPMSLRSGRFGPYVACTKFPECEGKISLDKKKGIKYPSPAGLLTNLPCPEFPDKPHDPKKPEETLYLRRGKKGLWLGCSLFPKCKKRLSWKKLDEAIREPLESAFKEHEMAHPIKDIVDTRGNVIADGTPVEDLLIEGNTLELDMHPDGDAPLPGDDS